MLPLPRLTLLATLVLLAAVLLAAPLTPRDRDAKFPMLDFWGYCLPCYKLCPAHNRGCTFSACIVKGVRNISLSLSLSLSLFLRLQLVTLVIYLHRGNAGNKGNKELTKGQKFVTEICYEKPIRIWPGDHPLEVPPPPTITMIPGEPAGL
jgi:hypothetical protein